MSLLNNMTNNIQHTLVRNTFCKNEAFQKSPYHIANMNNAHVYLNSINVLDIDNDDQAVCIHVEEFLSTFDFSSDSSIGAIDNNNNNKYNFNCNNDNSNNDNLSFNSHSTNFTFEYNMNSNNNSFNRNNASFNSDSNIYNNNSSSTFMGQSNSIDSIASASGDIAIDNYTDGDLLNMLNLYNPNIANFDTSSEKFKIQELHSIESDHDVRNIITYPSATKNQCDNCKTLDLRLKRHDNFGNP
eukprot:Awhi_evm1s1992